MLQNSKIVNLTDTLVSIIIPVHKTQSYLKPCVKSALDQSHKNIEILIVCNGDLKIEDCKNFLNFEDERLLFFKSESGRHNARNFALSLVKGKYVQFLDYDDILYASKIENQLYDLKKYNASISICKWKKFSESLTEYYSFPFDKLFELKETDSLSTINNLGNFGGFLSTGAYLIFTDLAKKAKWIDSPNDDAVYFSELCKENPKIVTLGKTLFGYRIHGQNTSTLSSKSQFKLLLNGWEKIEDNLKFYKHKAKNKYFFRSYLFLISKSKQLGYYKLPYIFLKCLKYSGSITQVKKMVIKIKNA